MGTTENRYEKGRNLKMDDVTTHKINKNRITTQDITVMALLTALLCISSYIIIPLPFTAVSLTAQTLVVNMIGLLMRPKKAGTIVGVWIVLGAVGLPVFSGGIGGLGKLLGPTGGYIIGAVVVAVLISLLKGKNGNIIRYAVVAIVVGMPVLYLLGMSWMMISAGMDWRAALVSSVLPFIPLDIAKCIAATIVVKPLERVVKA